MNNKFIWIVDSKKDCEFMAIICGHDDCGVMLLTEKGIKYMKVYTYGIDWIAYRIVGVSK